MSVFLSRTNPSSTFCRPHFTLLQSCTVIFTVFCSFSCCTPPDLFWSSFLLQIACLLINRCLQPHFLSRRFLFSDISIYRFFLLFPHPFFSSSLIFPRHDTNHCCFLPTSISLPFVTFSPLPHVIRSFPLPALLPKPWCKNWPNKYSRLIFLPVTNPDNNDPQWSGD